MRRLLTAFVLTAVCFSFIGSPLAQTDEGWTPVTEKDPISGKKTVSVGRFTENASYSQKSMLVVRCEEGKLDVILNFETYLGESQKRRVKYVFRKDGSDQSPDPVSAEWIMNTDGTAMFAPNEFEFVNKMVSHDKLSFRTWDHQNGEHTVEVDLTGFSRYKDKLSSCL